MDKITICSRASVMVGGNQIVSFDGSAEAIVADTLYDAIVEDVVSSYRWRCMTMQFQLSRAEAPPASRYDAAYQLPQHAQVIHTVEVGGTSIEFDRYGPLILCDASESDTVIADITYVANEAYWPGYFTSLVQLKLAAAFAVPIAEDTQKAAFYEGQFVRKMAAAKANDSQGRTARVLPLGRMRGRIGGQP